VQLSAQRLAHWVLHVWLKVSTFVSQRPKGLPASLTVAHAATTVVRFGEVSLGLKLRLFGAAMPRAGT
jgi:hypothetical protein